MKRLILLFTLICAFSINSLAATWSLNTWGASGELNKLTSKEFKIITSNSQLQHIDIPAGIELKEGNIFGLQESGGAYYKWQLNITENKFFELYTGGDGGDAKIISDFTCYQILLKFETGKQPQLYFSSVKPTPTIFTWAGGAFSDIVAGTPFTSISDNLYNLVIPDGSTPATANSKFLIKTSSNGGDIMYKSATETSNVANSWVDVASENTNDIGVALGTYYKILFDAASKKVYASTIPLKGIKPAAPKFLFDFTPGQESNSLELTIPTEIASVNPKFITKASVIHTVDGVEDETPINIPIPEEIVDGKISFILAPEFDPSLEHTYSVIYEYVDYASSTETLTTDASEITTIRLFPSAIKIDQDIKYDKANGNNAFIGAKIQWKAATNMNDIEPEYILSYSSEPISDVTTLIDGTNPTVEDGTYTQYVYGIPAGSYIEVSTSYNGIDVPTERTQFTYDIDNIATAPTGLEADKLVRHGKPNDPTDTSGDGKYSAALSWTAPNTDLAITGYKIMEGDANVEPIQLKLYKNNWEFLGIEGVLSEGVTFTGANNEATIRYSVAANYNIGNNVQTVITDEDYSRKNDITTHTSAAVVKDVLFNITAVTGVENATSDVVAVYPNPTTGTLVINNTTPIEKITIFNLAGSCVKEIGGSSDNSATIDIEELSQGTYFVKVNNTVTKVIKK